MICNWLANNDVSISVALLCCCQDEVRVHKVTKRLHTLEEVNINVKLLTEMLSHYDKDSSTDSDKEIIKVWLHQFIQELKLIDWKNTTVCNE